MKTVLTMLLSGVLLSQANVPPDAVAALKESLAENQKKLRTYSWVETTTITMKGEVKKQEQKQCYYGADGKVQKTPIGGAAAAKEEASRGGGGRGGRLKERVIENKVEEFQEYMAKAVALVHSYVPPEADKLAAAKAAGKLTAAPAGGTLNITAKDYLKPGDQL